jgi:hypothetical protein
MVSLGAAVLVGGYFAARAIRRNRRRTQVAKRRIEAFQRAWNRPERVAVKPRSSSGSREWVRKLVVAGAMGLATRLVRELASRPSGGPRRAATATYH